MTAFAPRFLGRAITAALLAASGCTRPSASPSASPASTPSSRPSATTPGPTVSSSPSAAAPATRTSVRLEPAEGGSFLVRGRYPRVPSRCEHPEQPSLDARYPGALTVKLSENGTLATTVTLPFERYLMGIAEVPPSWPMAALEAQAIAARSYALATTGWSGAEGQALRTPICASTSCQVFRGIPVPRDPTVRRWYAAVRRTTGEVLLYDGRPAETVYFSTSDGHTYGNDQVFGSAPLQYLRPVVERDDGTSPTSRWTVRLPFPDLRTFLAAAGEWPKGPPITRVGVEGTTIIVSGGGRSRSIDVDTLRTAVDTWAPCLEPGRYPSASRYGAALPVTIPSHWLTVSIESHAVVLHGRGWGHGVGMVQWGAYGKARRGMSASDILAYYYGGLRPRRYPEPGLIHVLVADGLTAMRVVPSSGGATLEGEPLGSGPITITGGDRLTVTSRAG